MIDRFGVARVDVRIVGGEDQMCVADLLDDIVGDHFVGLDGDNAVFFEIFARLKFDIGGPNIAVEFPSFIEAPE